MMRKYGLNSRIIAAISDIIKILFNIVIYDYDTSRQRLYYKAMINGVPMLRIFDCIKRLLMTPL